MVTAEDTLYPVSLQRDDKRRGRLDGEQRIPSLAEVRRQQVEVKESGGQLTIGYQVVLLAELNGRLDGLFPQYRRADRTALHELGEHDSRIDAAQDDVLRMRERLDAAAAELDEDDLRPRNPEEERWTAETVRNRRTVERTRLRRTAQEALDAALEGLRQRRVERGAAIRRRDESLAAIGQQAHRLVELYQQRIAAYLDALAQNHPDGRTLSPLLALSELPLPDWVVQVLPPQVPADGPAPSRQPE